ncbi:MAG: ABC transporter permease [Methanobacteriaceae archaeon]
MNYLKLIVKNPFRNKTRSSLAIVGIAIGIATIVALGLITSGLLASTETTLKEGAGEITVSKSGSNSFQNVGGSLNQSLVDELSNISGVEKTAGILAISESSNTENSQGTSSTGQNSPMGSFGMTVKGIEKDKLDLVGISDIEGELFNENKNEIILGKSSAENLNKSIGDTITVSGEEFKITGIYETGNIMDDNGAYTSLENLQILSSEESKVTNIIIKVNKDANVSKVSENINEKYSDELTTTTAEDQAERANNALGMIESATGAISLLAILIGGIGVINTMVMSVFERTREIGVLKAIGWRSRRILGMILGESIVLTLVAGIVGTVVGIIGVNLILLLTSVGAAIEPVYSLDIFIKAFGVALIVGVIGGIYPAYRASKLEPTEALRYE